MVGKGRIFVVLRDNSGTVQLLLSRDSTANFESILERFDRASHIEATISINGLVSKRPPTMINSEMHTGEFEILVKEITVLNAATQLPFIPNSSPLPEEEYRLKHRFLDLRRDELQKNIRMRAQVNQTIREYFSNSGTRRLKKIITLGFTEIETPILFKSTPEGAREFLVPVDRISPGSKFALPQSPQQFKQMLMAAGFDRYYQIARCFRDEGLRADRQPEFTQLDMEMSFVTMEDVMGTIEGAVKHLWKRILDIDLNEAFPKMTFAEALSRFGSDKPDIRYPFEIQHLAQRECIVTEKLVISSDIFPIVWSTLLPLIPTDKSVILMTNGQRITDLSKTTEMSNVEIIVERNLTDHVGSTLLGKIRTSLIRKLEGQKDLSSKYQIKELGFLWVNDFPLFARADNQPDSGLPHRTFESMHHPFTAPLPSDLQHLPSSPLQVRGQHYDLVLNGTEIGGGSIRIHDGDLQDYILRDIIQLPETFISHFQHLLAALRSGCPPHGGMALGLDRLVAIMCGASSIRDVIAFPKNSAGIDVCVGAPN